MNRIELEELLHSIEPADRGIMEEAGNRWNAISKPIGSLGKLEDVIIRMAGIQRSVRFEKENKKALLTYCADHGVVAEQVTQTGYEVTKIVADHLAAGSSSANIMAGVAGVDVYPVDIGMRCSHYPSRQLQVGAVADRKVACGTGNILREPAMTEEQCLRAIGEGISIVEELKQSGYTLLATGEMGIGNTTPTSAMTAVLLNVPVEQVTGKGAGLSDEAYQRKVRVLKQIVARHGKNTEPFFALQNIGSYEIAAMVGTFLGGAIYHVPVLMDGVISEVAALTAVRMNADVRDYIIGTHESREPSSVWLLQELKLPVFCQCEMRLGEGTGAMTAVPIIEMAKEVYMQMGTFEDYGIEAYDPTLQFS